MIILLLILSYVLAIVNGFWLHRGCFKQDGSHMTADYIKHDGGANNAFLRWSQCAYYAVDNGYDAIGLLNNGQCMLCHNCSFAIRAHSHCPDYGSIFSVQLFSLEPNDDNIPIEYKECSKNTSVRRCTDLHPLAYMRHSDVQHLFMSQPNEKTSQDKLVAILAESQTCEQTGHCTIDLSANTFDVCSRTFLDVQNTAELPIVWPPSQHLPPVLSINGTMEGRVPWLGAYYDDEKHADGSSFKWTSEVLEKALLTERAIMLSQYFSDTGVDSVRNKVGVVLGSITPWVEATLLQFGAAHLITVEYMPILSLIPRITTLTPLQLASRYLADNWTPVDFAFSYSSIEHSGLGRYGDPIDPNGDLKAIQQIACLIKPGGLLYLDVPTGPDALVYNAHRIYGRHRLPLLFKGWEFLNVTDEALDLDGVPSSFNFQEPIFILRKPLH